MGSFASISVVGLFCYAFLFMTLLAAKKSKLINAFLLLLGAMILWTGGSCLMRLQFWPSIDLWYDVSITGLMLLGYAFFVFTCEFVGYQKTFFKFFWGGCLLGMNAINWVTGFFIKAPVPVTGADGTITFLYHTSWPVIFLFIAFGMVAVHIGILFFRYCRQDELSRKQLMPILVGILILFAGHIGFLLPVFQGFPTDILGGVITAFCMFAALYKRRLFKLTLLFSRGSCYAMSAGLAILIFANLVGYIEDFVYTNLPMARHYETLLIALTFTVSTFLIYFVMKKFMDAVFVKEEMTQAERLKEFSLAVSKSLEIDEILKYLADIIQKSIAVKSVYVCISDGDDTSFSVAHSTNPLSTRPFSLRMDNPIVGWLEENDGCLLMKDFKRTVGYRSVWAEEKARLSELAVECFVPLRDEHHLAGIILLSGKERNAAYTYDDLNFLSSIDSIGSIAVKNSRLYRRAYLEARTDELTGLLNRKCFYETIHQEYEKNKDHALTLAIFNLDDFKLYNQLYGNKEGDRALQKVATILTASIGKSGFIARYSGKEFAAILPNYDPLSAKQLAENVRTQILNIDKESSNYSSKMLTVSVGICSTPYVAHNVQQLIHYADLAVYNIKRSGKNAVMLYSGDNAVPRDREQPENRKVESVYSEYANTIYALTAAIDTKDHYTFKHSQNVAYYSTEIARAMGMNAECIEIMKESALLHDIGKIGVPEQILNKPGKLSDEEYAIMKGHVEHAIGIIKHLPSLDYVIPAVLGHHERYDGHGYPRGIAGEEIPLMARILCVADSFDAMTSERSYKDPFAVRIALQELREQSGRQFDPEIAATMIQLVNSGAVQPVPIDAPVAAVMNE